MIARFAIAAERGLKEIADLETETTLQFIFTTLAAAQSGAFDVPLSEDPINHPGHLIFSAAGRTLYIPYHLAELFPSGEVLQYIVEQAEAVRVFTDSTICLSGSAAFGLQIASDIDFCEYVPHSGRRVAQSFLSKAAIAFPFCTEIRHNNATLEYPWVADQVLKLCTTDNGRIGGKCTCGSHDWKFDFVGYTEADGSLPISNLCVHEDDAEALSWSFQEIAITEKPRPIRHLVVPLELGKYVLWLRDQIDKYRAVRPHKALKRSLSLARILRLNAESERILAFLTTPGFVNQSRRNVADEIRRTIGRLPDALGSIVTRRTKAISNGTPMETETGPSNSDCQELLDDVARSYEDLLSRARKLVRV